MDGVKTFAEGVILVCVSAGVAMRLSPDGKLKKYLGYIISLCVLCAILAPLGKAIGGFEWDFITTEEASDGTGAERLVIDAEKAEIERSISSLISTKWDVGDVSVSLTLDESNVSAIEIRAIDIYISGQVPDGIEEYISDMFYGTAKVRVHGEGDKD